MDKTIPGWETLLCLFLHGPTWDGDVPSKSERDECVRRGHVARREGYQWLTAEGMSLCLRSGFGAEKERRESRRRHRSALLHEAAKDFHETYCPTCPDPVCRLGEELGLAGNGDERRT